MLPHEPFGRTGHDSTRVIFGAAALGGMSPDRADATLEQVRAAGIDHIDTARGYGESEVRLAGFLEDHRREVFLATKTGGRTGSEARRQLEQSLERMRVDSVDLIQLHNLVEPDEWKIAHRPDGATAAMVQARDEGLVRFIGVTGHGLRIAEMHRRSLDEFAYDSVLFPYNHSLLADDGYRSDVDALIERCRRDQVAIQTIKSIARRRWAADDGRPHYAWYEPLTDTGAIGRAVRFVLSRDGLFLNTSSDARQLAAVIDAAAGDLTPPSDAELAADEATFGIQPIFDGAALERI